MDKRAYLAELDADYLESNASDYSGFKVISKYPSIERDLALVTDENIEAKKILAAIRKAADTELLTDVQIFDVFQGANLKQEGKKSVAVRLTFRSNERTLVDDEVVKLIDNILVKLQTSLGIKLR